MRCRLVVGDTGTDLDGERDFAEDLRHADERFAELCRMCEESRTGTFVEDKVDRASAVDV